MTPRQWDRAIAAKVTVGLILALLAPAVAAVANIATRHWPAGTTPTRERTQP